MKPGGECTPCPPPFRRYWCCDTSRRTNLVKEESVVGENKTFYMCSTGQLEVSHVVPVIFLSNNLGPAVLPKSVEQQDFESSLKSLNNESVKKNLVSSWYTLDSQNQPACYRLKPISANIPTILVSPFGSTSCKLFCKCSRD